MALTIQRIEAASAAVHFYVSVKECIQTASVPGMCDNAKRIVDTIVRQGAVRALYRALERLTPADTSTEVQKRYGNALKVARSRHREDGRI